MLCMMKTGDGTRCVRQEGHEGSCSPEWPLAPETKVRHTKTGDIGTIKRLAKLQTFLPNLLYIVHFEKLGELRQVSVKLTRDLFTEVY